MSSAQKVIKGLAIAFAIFLIINIFSAIILGTSIFSLYLLDRYPSEQQKTKEENKVVQSIETIENLKENVRLKIDLKVSNLEIKEGSTGVVQLEKQNVSTNVTCKVIGDTLEIREKNQNWFKGIDGQSKLIVYLPKNMILDMLNISMGAGLAEVQDINTEKLDIDAGAGKITLTNISSKKTNIDGGAGKLTINNAVLNDLDLDCGVGLTRIAGDIRGKSKISCGVGRTELDLIQTKDEYTIRTETGIGSITLNGEKCLDDGNYGNGENIIKIDGGVGSVEIKTK